MKQGFSNAHVQQGVNKVYAARQKTAESAIVNSRAGNDTVRPATTRDLMKSLREIGGNFDPDVLGLFSIMRDEMWFLPAFLDYYRGIGVRQFVILDDGSLDGTREHLLAQPDVVVLASEYGFGAPARVSHVPVLGSLLPFLGKEIRAGRAYKELIPQRYFKGKYALYADADEFLFLPPGLSSLAQVIDRLKAVDADCIAASFVEFFPASLPGLDEAAPSESFEELLKRYSFFEKHRLLTLQAGQQPNKAGKSKSSELFETHLPDDGIDRHSPVLKTPIVRHNARTRRVGSHRTTQPPVPDMLLTMAHFVFTGRFRDKVARAIEWKSHRGGGEKYRQYADLLKTMEQAGGSFEGPNTAKFADVGQFLQSGLMLWPKETGEGNVTNFPETNAPGPD